jgi:hypothetical protein
MVVFTESCIALQSTANACKTDMAVVLLHRCPTAVLCCRRPTVWDYYAAVHPERSNAVMHDLRLSAALLLCCAVGGRLRGIIMQLFTLNVVTL